MSPSLADFCARLPMGKIYGDEASHIFYSVKLKEWSLTAKLLPSHPISFVLAKC